MNVLFLTLAIYSYLFDACCISIIFPVDARNAGMGREIGVALFQSPAAFSYNPAAIGFREWFSVYTTNLSTSGAIDPLIPVVTSKKFRRMPPWFPNDTTNVNLALGMTYKLPFKGNFVMGIQYHGFYFGETEYDPALFNPGDHYIDFALAKEMTPWFSVGAGLKHIHMNTTPPGIIDSIVGRERPANPTDYAFDFGVAFRSRYGLSVGASVQNIGPDMKYTDGSSAPLPRIARVGASLRADQLLERMVNFPVGKYVELLGSYEYQQDLMPGEPVKIKIGGVELGLFRTLYFRMGKMRLVEPNSRVGYATSGVGLRIGALNIDLASNRISEPSPMWILVGKHWVSVSLNYPYSGPVYDNPTVNETIGFADAVLVPGGGHIYKGNYRGIAYFLVSSVLMRSHFATHKPVYRNLAAGVYVISLIDYVLNYFVWQTGEI